MADDLFYLIYVSAADHLMTDAELLEILETSRRNNAASGLTGLLLYKENRRYENGSFMQLLEGEREAVLECYATIARDKRHHTIIQLDKGQIGVRNFPSWRMGFRSVATEDLQRIPGFANVGDHSFDSAAFTEKARDALEMMKTFYDATD
jgi:hypothetical protein